jgi:branched-chain amino acid aminotransferase
MSRISEAAWIWRDGQFVPWREATIHVLSTAVQFGSSVFEGIRCYDTPNGPAIFRLGDHIRRLFDSARVYRMEMRYTRAEIEKACGALVAKNGLDACYVRPMVLRGYGAAGLAAISSPIEVFIACWPWGTYLGAGALEEGVDVRVSSWLRPAPNTFPALAKAAGNYINSQLIKWEAQADGYAEAIALGPGGVVSEGSGQNLFLVRDGVLITPPLDGTSLAGITRDSILKIARDLGIEAREQIVQREALYTADVLFFTGTAAEVTPIRSVDRIRIGDGVAGPVTRALQDRFLKIVHGEAEDPHGWLTYIRPVEVPA